MQELSYVASPQRAIATKTGLIQAPSELTFYGEHAWCLNAFPTVNEAVNRLSQEIEALSGSQPGWQRSELEVNVVFLACAISEVVDDFLGGPRYDFSRVTSVFRAAGSGVRQVNRAVRLSRKVHTALYRDLQRWRDRWESAVFGGTRALASYEPLSASWTTDLRRLLRTALPASLRRSHIRVPAAFRSQDLTHLDAFRLGDRFSNAFPDRDRPVLVVGLRTAGSYFAPLLRGFLEARGYQASTITLRPKRGVGIRERAALEMAAKQGALAAVIDEPVYSGSTVAKGVDCLREAGFRLADVAGLFPTHPNVPDWKTATGTHTLSEITVITLDPEGWYKQQVLRESAPARIREYYALSGLDARVVASEKADCLTAELENALEPGMHWRLKRVYEVQIHNGSLPDETRYVLAKSAGWGWLGYHAFLAGTRLTDFVPPVLGLRDGIVYMEWLCARAGFDAGTDRARLVETAGAYVAARRRILGLSQDPTRGLIEAARHRGTEEIA